MDQSFPVIKGNQTVGSAHVAQMGLYYSFTCYCHLPIGKIYSIRLSDGKSEINLGICVPEGGKFYLRKKIPVKCLEREGWTFNVIAQGEKQAEQFYPVVPHESVNYLNKLDQAKLKIVENRVGIILPEDQVPSL